MPRFAEKCIGSYDLLRDKRLEIDVAINLQSLIENAYAASFLRGPAGGRTTDWAAAGEMELD
jgi:hypothetical protein